MATEEAELRQAHLGPQGAHSCNDWTVHLSQLLHNRHHRQGGLNNRNLLSQSWRLEVCPNIGSNIFLGF